MLNSLQKLPSWLRLGIIFPLAFLNGWLLFLLLGYLEPLTTILITSALLAFILEIPIRRLEQHKIPRGWAISLVFLLTLIILSLIALILVPLIINQLNDLLTVLPKWLESGNDQIQAIQEWAITRKLSVHLDTIVGQAADKISAIFQSFGNQALTILGGTISYFFNTLFILVLTIFLVLMGKKVLAGIFSWVPAPWNTQLQETMRQTFETYFATQAILAGILSATQMLVFFLLNVPYAVLFGVMIGLTTLIPYASSLTIILISSILMFQDAILGIKVLIAAIILGQINDQIIAPRLMGGAVGLNPVWIIIALFIGGKLAGVLGLIIAVPLASVIKITVDKLRYHADFDGESNLKKLPPASTLQQPLISEK